MYDGRCGREIFECAHLKFTVSGWSEFHKDKFIPTSTKTYIIGTTCETAYMPYKVSHLQLNNSCIVKLFITVGWPGNKAYYKTCYTLI